MSYKEDDMLMQKINKQVYENIGKYSMKSSKKYTNLIGLFLIVFALVFLPAVYAISIDNLPKFLKTKDENDVEKVNIINLLIISMITALIAVCISYNYHH